MRTGFHAIRLGIILFIIPFFFVFQPAFVLHGTLWEILKVLGTGFFGVILIASGLEGYLVMVGSLGTLKRLMSILSGVLLLTPDLPTDLIGALLAAILVAGRFLRSKPE